MKTKPRPFISVGTKLALATLLVLVAVSFVIYQQLTKREHARLVGAKTTAASMLVDLFAEVASSAVEFDDLATLQSDIKLLGLNQDVLYVAVWRSDHDTPEGTPHRRPLAPERDEPAQDPLHKSVQIRADRVIVTLPLAGGNAKPVGYVVVHFSLANENATFESSKRSILGTNNPPAKPGGFDV